jgi:hypothetical protein
MRDSKNLRFSFGSKFKLQLRISNLIRVFALNLLILHTSQDVSFSLIKFEPWWSAEAPWSRVSSFVWSSKAACFSLTLFIVFRSFD